MASTSKHHHELTDGVGKCSVPMWMMGCPAGFCDNPAYGKRPECATFFNYASREAQRVDGRYNGYVPGLACVGHGGPAAPVITDDGGKSRKDSRIQSAGDERRALGGTD